MLISRRENPSELTERFLMALVWDLGKVAGKLQAHPFAWADCAFIVLFEPVEEIADWHAQNLSNLE